MTLKFVIRNLLKRPFLNLIKVIGLSLALSGILLIALFLKNELTFDSHHTKSDRIYRFTYTHPEHFNGNHFARIYDAGYIPQMAEYFPEIENYVRLVPIRGGVLKHKENYVYINQAFECDSSFFNVFDSVLIAGNPENMLSSPGSMVVTESFAKKAFGKLDPLGQTLTRPTGQYYGKNVDYTVKGIMRDFPQNSHFHPEFITSPTDKSYFESWAWTYLLLSDNADPGKILSGYKDFYAMHIAKDTADIKTQVHLQKLTDIHLYSDKLREIEPNSNMSVIYTLAIAALILFLIALTNYANLNISMANFSEKYLFISKMIGSTRWMNLKYFLLEALIIILVVIVSSAIITSTVNLVIQKHFGLNLLKGNTTFVLLVTISFSLLAILSGILPILKNVLNNIIYSEYKNNNKLKRKGISKSLIIIQYAISIMLIVALFVIQRQTAYALNNSMGSNAGNLICFENLHSNVQQKFELFKEELLKYNSIKFVSAMFEPPGGEANDMFQFEMEGYIPDRTTKEFDRIGIFPCDYSFASIFNLLFLSGSNFSEKYEDNDGSAEYIINESAMKRLHYVRPDEILGKELGIVSNQKEVKIPSGKIIGIVKDFHFSSIKKEVGPLVLFKRKDIWLSNFVVSFQPGMQKRALSDIESVWTKMFHEYPLQIQYVNSMYENVYRKELLQSKLLSIFTFIALFICSMGLLGMSLLATQRRTKEIGIRKVNGAKIAELLIMLNWDLIKWILISILIAIPIAFYAMNKWLENFAYRTTLSWWIFVLAGFAAILISVITVSFNSWKAATRNPVEALRYE